MTDRSPDRSPAIAPIRPLAPPLADHRDRYELEDRPFAIGGMGQVWAAYDHDLDREVAVKVLRPELVGDLIAYERFAHETWVLAQLDHPGIVPIHDRYLTDDPPCFTMKRVRGESLAARIRRTHAAVGHWRSARGQQALRELVSVVIGICRTVAFAHSRGLVHRDLKPANVLLGDYGEVLVMDWGLAAPTGRPRAGMRTGGADPSMTESRSKLPLLVGEPLGTPSHMAPEQARGDRDAADERVDVFGIGALLFEILTNQRPWPGASDTAVATAREGRLDAPRQRAPGLHVPRELDAVVQHATAAAMAERYPDIDALRHDLEAWLDHRPLSVGGSNLWSRAVKRARRHPARAIGVSLGVGLALMATVLVSELSRAAGEAQRHERELEMARVQLLLADGRAMVTAGDYATAVEDFSAVLATRPDHVEALCGRAAALINLGRVTEALADTSRALERDQTHHDLWTVHAMALVRAGRRAEAAMAFDRAVAAAPRDQQLRVREIRQRWLED